MINKINYKGTLHELNDSRLYMANSSVYAQNFDDSIHSSDGNYSLFGTTLARWVDSLSSDWWSMTAEERARYRYPILLKGETEPVPMGTLLNSCSAMVTLFVSSDEANQSNPPAFQGYAYTNLGQFKFWYSNNSQQVQVDGDDWPGGHVVKIDNKYYCDMGELSGNPDA